MTKGKRDASVIHLILQPQIIRDHGDELGICGLAAVVLYRVTEVGIERIHVAAIPRDLNGVADHEKSIGLFVAMMPLAL